MKKIYLIVLLATLISASFYGQCMINAVPLSSRVNNSVYIVEGKVLAQRSFWNEARNYIYTSCQVQVLGAVKGQHVPAFLEIITEGGEIGLNKQTVEPSLQLKEGEEGIFMLNNFNQPSQFGFPVFQTYADQQGFIKFNREENTATEPFKKYNGINNELKSSLELALGRIIAPFGSAVQANKLLSSSSVAAVSGISPSTITAGTSSTLTITGTGFGATQGTSYVEFSRARLTIRFVEPDPDPGAGTDQSLYRLRNRGHRTSKGYSGRSGTLSAQTLTVNYGELNVYYSNTLTPVQVFNTRHVDLNSQGGITWQMYTGFDANAAAKASFLRAFNTWRCNTLIDWLVGTAVSTNTIAADGVDVVRFDVGAELPAGVLGRCTSYFSGCSLGTTIYFYVSELDICFDDATNWQLGPALATGTQYDFESVAVHELGHGHQLSHVINTNDFMHFSIASAQNKRIPISNDIAAGNDVMARNLSGGVCNKGTMVALAAGVCSVAIPTASFNVVSPVCTGQTVMLNDLSAGQPTNWSWTMSGGTPASATVQNTSASFAAAGIHTITLVATNGMGSSAPYTKTISVVAIPSVAVSSASICSGATATLTATGAVTYTWNPGNVTGATQSFSPSSTTVYNVTGSNGTCTNTATGTLSVVTTPTVSVSGTTICAGSSAVINASGAASYTWNPGGLNGAMQTLSPGSTTSYTVLGKTSTCNSNAALFTITVNNNPTITVAASQSLICTGQSVTLTASGAAGYTFSPGLGSTNPAVDAPTVTTTYMVDGQTAGCNSNTFSVTVSVSPCTGIAQVNANSHFIIYPNPTQGLMTISFNGTFSGKISVYNSLGQVLVNKEVSAIESLHVDMSNYAKGMYIVKFSQDNRKDSFMKVTRD